MFWAIAGALVIGAIVVAMLRGGGGGYTEPDPEVSDFVRGGGRMYGVRYHDGQRYQTDRYLDAEDIGEAGVQDRYRQYRGVSDVETWEE
jgi:hypothetical protein